MILSATQSERPRDLAARRTATAFPPARATALQPYVRQNLKFFVAKVNLAEQAKTGFAYLRPLQFAFESERFMLPVRLGMLNAKGPQDLVVYALTRNGRVETTNYRTVKLPANVELPTYVRGEFAPIVQGAVRDAGEARGLSRRLDRVLLGHGWCDPCAADPLSPDELRGAGVFWLDGDEPAIGVAPGAPRRAIKSRAGGAQPVMLTRLHLRYTRDTLPEDLMFQETQDRQNFQARYVLRHPWSGDANACAEAQALLRRGRAAPGTRSADAGRR